jgi:drug/metabolite transporter (DMT)-like permease
MISFLAYGVAALAVSCSSLLSPIAKKIGPGLPPFTFIAASSGILMIVSGVAAWFVEREKVVATAGEIRWHWLLAFSLVNVVSYALFLWVINRVPVTHYQMFVFLSPIVGGIAAVFLLGEPFHVRYIPALGFMLVGLLIAVKPWAR